MGRHFELIEEDENTADSESTHTPQQLSSFSSPSSPKEEEISQTITSKDEEEGGAAVLNGWVESGTSRVEEEGISKLVTQGEEEGGAEGGIEEKKLEPANKGVLPWLALLVLCMCPLGGYLAYDVPGALNIAFKEEMGLTLTQIGALYTAYAIPTVLTSPFCGIANQYFGTHRLLVVCNALLTLGAFGFAFAENYTLMIFARILFGSGAEILFVAGSLQIEKWFRHSKYIGFAFGACSCFPLIGTICAFAALPPISSRWSLRGALLIAAAFVGFSTAMASIYATFIHPHLKFATAAESKVEKVTLSNILKSVRGIQREFWLLGLYVFSIYTTGFSFLAVAGRFFNEKYGFSDIYSSWLICLFSAVAFLFGPLLTIVLDKILRRVTVGIVAGIFNTGIYIVFGFTNLHPVYTLIVAAFSFVAGSTTTLCLTSKFASGKDIGILFSLISVFQNLTFLTMPVIFGAIRDSTGGYEWSCSFFAFASFLGTLCLVVLRMLKIGENLDVGPDPNKVPTMSVELVNVECTKDYP